MLRSHVGVGRRTRCVQPVDDRWGGRTQKGWMRGEPGGGVRTDRWVADGQIAGISSPSCYLPPDGLASSPSSWYPQPRPPSLTWTPAVTSRLVYADPPYPLQISGSLQLSSERDFQKMQISPCHCPVNPPAAPLALRTKLFLRLTPRCPSHSPPPCCATRSQGCSGLGAFILAVPTAWTALLTTPQLNLLPHSLCCFLQGASLGASLGAS